MNTADKDVKLVLGLHDAAPPLKARDGRGALPYPTDQQSPNP